MRLDDVTINDPGLIIAGGDQPVKLSLGKKRHGAARKIADLGEPMDVRKPKFVNNWREFLKEYAIIVVGVLTALLAEQAVQSIDWHHKVDAAIGDMSQELGNADGPESYARLAMHDCLANRLTVSGRQLKKVTAAPAET